METSGSARCVCVHACALRPTHQEALALGVAARSRVRAGMPLRTTTKIHTSARPKRVGSFPRGKGDAQKVTHFGFPHKNPQQIAHFTRRALSAASTRSTLTQAGRH
eukprot:5087277-Amphidinium_carterae.1